MEKVAVTCPKCGFSKEFPAESIPKGPFRINCPKCKEASVIKPGGTVPAPVSSAIPPEREAPVSVPPAPEPPIPAQPAPKPPAPEPPVPPPPAPVAPVASPEAGMVQIVCPGCGFRKEVKAGLVPEGAAITCPQCKERFFFTSGPSDEAGEDNTSGLHTGEKEAPASEKPRPSYTPEKPTIPQSRTPVQTPAANIGTGGDLPGIGELFGSTWEIYKERVWTLLGLYILFILSFAIPVGIVIGIAKSAPEIGMSLILTGALACIAISLVFSTWSFAALLVAVVDGKTGIADAVNKGKHKILPFAWLYTLMTLILMVGYTLLIIPGIALTVSFFFAQYILAEDDTRGLDSLLKSRAYVKGYWWGIFYRALIVGIVSAILQKAPYIGLPLSLAFAPFMFIYFNMNYRALKEIKGDIGPEQAGGRKAMTLLAVLGAVILALTFAVMAYGILQSPEGMSQFQKLLNPSANKPAAVIRNEEPRLWLDKATYAPGEQMAVHFTAPASFEDNAWVGIFPADAPHGSEETNDQNKLIFQYLRKRTSGDLVFIGTTRPGSYDLRMNDNDSNGTEVATVPFTVVVPAPQPEQAAPPLPAR